MGMKCLAHGHNTAPWVRIEPTTLRSRVPRSPNWAMGAPTQKYVNFCFIIDHCRWSIWSLKSVIYVALGQGQTTLWRQIFVSTWFSVNLVICCKLLPLKHIDFQIWRCRQLGVEEKNFQGFGRSEHYLEGAKEQRLHPASSSEYPHWK